MKAKKSYAYDFDKVNDEQNLLVNLNIVIEDGTISLNGTAVPEYLSRFEKGTKAFLKKMNKVTGGYSEEHPEPEIKKKGINHINIKPCGDKVVLKGLIDSHAAPRKIKWDATGGQPLKKVLAKFPL